MIRYKTSAYKAFHHKKGLNRLGLLYIFVSVVEVMAYSKLAPF